MRTRTAVLLAALALTAEAQTFRVSGTVVDSETGRPLNRTRVVLGGRPGPEWTVITSDDGRFSFDVPQGKYPLSAAHRDWGDVYGEPAPGSDTGALVATGPNRDTTQLVFRFRGPIAVRGKIVDESGEPVPSATVEVFHRVIDAGRTRLVSLGRAEANDFGEYYFSWLPAGTYYLAASGEPWYSSSLYGYDELDSGPPPVPYAAVYFPGTADPESAAPLALRPGAEFRADFTLRPAAGADIRPLCAEAMPCGGHAIMLHAVGPGIAETLIRDCQSGCAERIAAVPPGRYILRYHGPAGVAQTMIDVHGGDLPIQLEPKPLPALAGKIAFQNPAERPAHPLYVNLADEETGEIDTIAAGPDGSFAWPAVETAHARLFLSGSDGFYVAGISVEGAEVKNGVIHLAGGASARVTVLASGATGRVSGSVMEGDHAAGPVLVVLAPRGGSADLRRYLASQAASDGTFDFPKVPAGDYVLFASDNLELAYADPEATLPDLAQGTRIRVPAGSSRIETVRLTRKRSKSPE